MKLNIVAKTEFLLKSETWLEALKMDSYRYMKLRTPEKRFWYEISLNVLIWIGFGSIAF
jgi:hypothetical protein